MTDHLTRRQLLERGVLGGAAIAFPGIARRLRRQHEVAGGTTAVEAEAREDAALLELDALHRRNNKSQTHPSLDRVPEEVRRPRRLQARTSTTTPRSSGRSRASCARGQSIGRDIIVMTDNSRYPSLLVKKGWAEKLDKSAIPNIKNLVAGPAAPGLRPEPRLQPAVAVRA